MSKARTLTEELERIDAALVDGTATPKQERRGLQLTNLFDASQRMFDALQHAELQLDEYCRAESGHDRDAHRALRQVRAAIRAAEGGNP